MNKYKKIKPIIFISLGLLIFIIGITYAYFYSRNIFENKFKTSAYDVELSEEFKNDWGTKKVNIINKDTTPVVIRVNYNEIWSEKDFDNLNDNFDTTTSCRILSNNDNTKKYTLSNLLNGEEVVTKNWTSTWNNFSKGNDGWYYYNKVLDSNTSIQILESISLREDLLADSNCYEDYNNYEYELSFNYEAIQADEQAIKEIWNYEADLNNGDNIWNF